MKYILLIIISYSLNSCNVETRQQENVTESTQSIFFPNYERGDIKTDTLYLDVIVDECGEFGGPRDMFKIYVNSTKKYKLEYNRFKFNCDSIEYYYDLKVKPLELKTDISINEEKKEVVSLFLENLLRGKISERVYTNAGSYYHLYNSDSTLNISIHSENKKLEEDFYNFKRGLGFPENKRKLNK